MIDLSLSKRLNAPGGEMLLQLELQIDKGQLVGLYGKSGAGKTSLLRLLAGLTQADEGRIVVDGKVWLDKQKRIDLPPQKRNIGFVFQDYALFPNMTVAENLHFARSKGQSDQIIKEIIDVMELGDLQNKSPQSLSGGQQQRVALARALVQRPQILLLDEPLSALDPDLRYKLQQYILNVHRQFQLTTILISHDVAEMLRLADRCVVLDEGKIVQQAPPMVIFGSQHPGEQFSLTGEIIGIHQVGSDLYLSVLCGTAVLKVQSPHGPTAKWKIGDQIQLSATAFQATIHKSGS
ncbi:MAG: ABC transporter ATP-binding protein [Bacteroidota bacterium]